MLERIVSATGVVYYRSPLLAARAVPHAFSTRIGGVSAGLFASLNLGNPSEGTQRDPSDNIETNYRRLCESIGLAGRPRCSVHQVHGPTILTVGCGETFPAGQKADGLISDDPSRLLAVRVADCVPVLLAAEDGRRVAALHAGWRGVIAEIVPRAVNQLKQISAATIVAAIGPCISAKHFQVGPEVVVEFRRAFGDAVISRESADGKAFVDLPAAIARQLRAAGLREDQIDRTDRCTFEHSDEFFSHRRDHGVTGRMAALIEPRPS